MKIRIYTKTIDGEIGEGYNVEIEIGELIDDIVKREHLRLDKNCRGEYIIAVLIVYDKESGNEISSSTYRSS